MAKLCVQKQRQPLNLIGMMKMESDMRGKEALLLCSCTTAIQSSQFGNRVNLIWLALGIQMRPIYLYPLHFPTCCYYELHRMNVCQMRHFQSHCSKECKKSIGQNTILFSIANDLKVCCIRNTNNTSVSRSFSCMLLLRITSN